MKKKILIVIADYYEEIAKGLLNSSLKSIPKKSLIKIIRVPGVFEIPVTISKNIKRYDAFLALGCVIKGETPHFDFICNSTFISLLNLSTKSNKPIGNGIITALNKTQAIERSKKNNSKKVNKGLEAANAVLSILNNAPKKI
jgi:6,7-dimethyl-8-ribityllumazine synthase